MQIRVFIPFLFFFLKKKTFKRISSSQNGDILDRRDGVLLRITCKQPQGFRGSFFFLFFFVKPSYNCAVKRHLSIWIVYTRNNPDSNTPNMAAVINL
jgi:hypothetical protein